MFIRMPIGIRSTDLWGSGEYGASRDGGKRKHMGVDLVYQPDSEILSAYAGIVTKIGYPYNPSDEKKGLLRYVEVTSMAGNISRYFYVKPSVQLHQQIWTGGVIGISQRLTDIYPGITPHFHFEVFKLKDNKRDYINPMDYLS